MVFTRWQHGILIISRYNITSFVSTISTSLHVVLNVYMYTKVQTSTHGRHVYTFACGFMHMLHVQIIKFLHLVDHKYAELTVPLCYQQHNTVLD